MSYDGYGRLKTKHVPEQDANANTVWDYNADDTIQKITDGRGISTFYAYNQRHLLTRITYSVPGEITYTYDAASNRTSMSDGAGATSYHYDSLSRMSSESRTFIGYSGTYTLNYSYNLANALTVLSIPFRSQEIGYNYDNAGRLSSVTGSGFTARYGLWPNVNTQSITSFASNIAYRAWGARKSMTYGNTTSEQTEYNLRLQPITYTLNNMNYQNTNICCAYPTYSTMTWTFDYYNDGRVKTMWDSTNDWFDRAYKYDHAGRLKEASTYRRARGLSPYPSNPYPDPYYQNITYDAFNHLSRSGLLYTGEPSDVGTWANNRRTGPGWQYDADGNTIIDPNFTQTFDAAGKPSHSVSFARVGDGANYPYQPATDITQTYDGAGAPGKREQIARQPDGEGPPLEDIQTTYYLRSTVLGVAIVELNSPTASDIVNVYAGGQRIARDESENVSFEHPNPVTGSRVTSAGYSAYRGTTRQERDSFGAEIPTANPYPTAQDYGAYKFGEQFYILGGDPFDYSTGREIDGIPVSETEFQRRTGNGSAVGDVSRGGRFAGSLDLSKDFIFTRINILFEVFELPLGADPYKTMLEEFRKGSFTAEVDLFSSQTTRNQKSTKPQTRLPLPSDLRSRVSSIVSNTAGDCEEYIKKLLAQVSTNGKAFSDDALDLFDRVGQSGFKLKKIKDSGQTNFEGNRRVVYINPGTLSGGEDERHLNHDMNAYAVTALNELMHHARKSGIYTDRMLAEAAFQLLTPEERLNNPLPKSKSENANSEYFHPLFNNHCRSPSGE